MLAVYTPHVWSRATVWEFLDGIQSAARELPHSENLNFFTLSGPLKEKKKEKRNKFLRSGQWWKKLILCVFVGERLLSLDMRRSPLRGPQQSLSSLFVFCSPAHYMYKVLSWAQKIKRRKELDDSGLGGLSFVSLWPPINWHPVLFSSSPLFLYGP